MFQWQMIAYIFIIWFLSYLLGLYQTVEINGLQEPRVHWLPALAMAVPLIYCAGTRKDMDFGDTSAYRAIFHNFPDSLSGLSDYLAEDSKDKGFSCLGTFLKSIIGDNDVVFFMIIALISLGCVIYVYKKYSCNFFFTIFLFVVSADYLQWNYNGMRQFIAVAVIFACFGWIYRRKYIPAILIILLMSTVHASALIMIPIIFIIQGKPWNIKTVAVIIMALVAIVFLDQFTSIITTLMENTQYSNEVDQYLATEGTNMLRVIVYSIPAILAFVFRRNLIAADNQMINVCANMSIVTAGLYLVSAFTSGLFIGRLPIYTSLYSYILLPWIIQNCLVKDSRKLVYVPMVILYLIYYYYQVVVTWGLT